MNMSAAIPDYILSSGLVAQRTRSHMTASTVGSDQEIDVPLPEAVEDSEIKSVLRFVTSAQSAWPQDLRFDVPRIINF
ncbi:hypothetical protein DL89DRAFT_292154 [Linderina pennispora]|uniref:Uncharacterized protein n=1 Tax=Linderina pennispora TaxID=61395 RepID=A0A1Y1WAA3_9FUNG|nr:uncharacterized protein DL89DRAFT_292154 [Linderina pennispora]ORX70480.1 hypothetical protein DL89DRAFT_292154 [Linderina pennispora]